jgi:hypothetical protein
MVRTWPTTLCAHKNRLVEMPQRRSDGSVILSGFVCVVGTGGFVDAVSCETRDFDVPT